LLSISPDDLELRSYSPISDKSFIYSSWLKTYKKASYFAKRIRNDVFFKEHHKIIDYLFSKPTIAVLIACPKGDPDTITGYLVYEPNKVVHFIYIKDAYRSMGIARVLFEKALIDPSHITFSHWTNAVDEFIKKYPEIIYDPYAL